MLRFSSLESMTEPTKTAHKLAIRNIISLAECSLSYNGRCAIRMYDCVAYNVIHYEFVYTFHLLSMFFRIVFCVRCLFVCFFVRSFASSLTICRLAVKTTGNTTRRERGRRIAEQRQQHAERENEIHQMCQIKYPKLIEQTHNEPYSCSNLICRKRLKRSCSSAKRTIIIY